MNAGENRSMEKTLTELRFSGTGAVLRKGGGFVRRFGGGFTARDRFTVALSGGSTPRGLYELLASERYRTRISWEKASVLREVLEGERHPERLPCQLIRPENGLLLFILDRAAAKELTIR